MNVKSSATMAVSNGARRIIVDGESLQMLAPPSCICRCVSGIVALFTLSQVSGSDSLGVWILMQIKVALYYTVRVGRLLADR